jgi:benzil reductase ((S)-benzoin forming)
MNHFIITGTSRGIGKALAENILKGKENSVTGISRNQSLSHPNYKHFSIDLSDITTLKKFLADIFPKSNNADKIVLINNAGIVGQVGKVGNIESENIERVFNVNLISPAILINEFIKKYKDLSCQKVIMNISSGAGKYPVDGWSSYCSSKAGLDMFSLVIDEEQKLNGYNFKIFSVSPGVVDTDMQTQIRKVSAEDFSEVKKFQSYKENGNLKAAAKVAEKLLYLLDHPNDFHDVLNSVRDF